MQIKFIAPVATLALGAISLFAQTTQTITGTVTDAMCGAHHMKKHTTPARCTRECVKQGSDFALVSGGKVYTLSSDFVLASGGKVYTLKGDKTQFDKFAGQKVVIKGTAEGSTITVASIRITRISFYF